MIPLLGLGALAAATMAGAYTVAIAREARRPRRATFAWALAHGTPGTPDQVPGVLEWREGATTITGNPTNHAGSGLRAQEVELPWWIVRGSGTGSLLLVHGWGRSRWDSLRRLPWLLPHASTLMVPDLPGHGEATGTTGVGATDHLVLDRLLPSLHAAAAAQDPSTACQAPASLTLVGHSMGAMVAARLAALLADRGTPVRRLILMAPYDTVLVPMANRLRLRGLPAGPFVHAAAAWVGSGGEPLHDTLARINCPVLVIGGALDAVTTPADLRAAAPGAETWIEPGIDHADVGVQGMASREAIEAFFART